MTERNVVGDFSTDTGGAASSGLPTMPGAVSSFAPTAPRIETPAGLDLTKAMQAMGSSLYQAAAGAAQLAKTTKSAQLGEAYREGDSIAVEFGLRYKENNLDMTIPTPTGEMNMGDWTIESIGSKMEASGPGQDNLATALRETTEELIRTRIPADSTPEEINAIYKRSYGPILGEMTEFYNREVIVPHKKMLEDNIVEEIITRQTAGRIASIFGAEPQAVDGPLSPGELKEILEDDPREYWLGQGEVDRVLLRITEAHADSVGSGPGRFDRAFAQLEKVPDTPENAVARDKAAQHISEKRRDYTREQLGIHLESLNEAEYTLETIVPPEIGKLASEVATDDRITDGGKIVIDAIESWAQNTPLDLQRRDEILGKLDETVEAFLPGGTADNAYGRMRRSLPDEDDLRMKQKREREDIDLIATREMAAFIIDKKFTPPVDGAKELVSEEDFKKWILENYEDDGPAYWIQYLELKDKYSGLVATPSDGGASYMKYRGEFAAAKTEEDVRRIFFDKVWDSANGKPHDGVQLTATQMKEFADLVDARSANMWAEANRDPADLINDMAREFANTAGGAWKVDGSTGLGSFEWEQGFVPGAAKAYGKLRDEMSDAFFDARFDGVLAAELEGRSGVQRRAIIRKKYNEIKKKFLGDGDLNLGADGVIPPDITADYGKAYFRAKDFRIEDATPEEPQQQAKPVTGGSSHK